MSTLAEGQFGTGALQDVPDSRDKLFSAVTPFPWEIGFDIELLLGYRKTVSYDDFFGVRGRDGWGVERYKEIVKICKEKNIKPFLIPTKNQGGSSSCVGQADAYYLSVLNMIETGEWVEFSARDVYAYISSGHGKGASIRDAMNLNKKRGVGLEELVPSYNIVDGEVEPMSETQYLIKPEVSVALDTIRDKYKAENYRTLPLDPTEKLESMAWACLLNFGCYTGVSGEDNGTWRKEWPQPPKRRQWGHALFAGKVGLASNGEKYIGIKNSWGDSVGIKGWQKLGKVYFFAQLTDLADSVYNPWTIIDLPNNHNQTVMKIIDNTLYQLVESPGGFALGLDGKLIIDDLASILASWQVRNAGNTTGKTATCSLADWNSVPHINLKRELLPK